MLPFETLLRLLALLRQPDCIPSFKFLIWNFVTGDGSLQLERGSETNKSTTCCFTAGQAWEATAVELDGVLPWRWVPGIMRKFPERMLIESGRRAPRTGSSNGRGREINIDNFPIWMVWLLRIVCHKRIVSLHNTSLIRYWDHSARNIPDNRLTLFAEVCRYTLTILDII
jgi:hypothetical protein